MTTPQLTGGFGVRIVAPFGDKHEAVGGPGLDGNTPKGALQVPGPISSTRNNGLGRRDVTGGGHGQRQRSRMFTFRPEEGSLVLGIPVLSRIYRGGTEEVSPIRELGYTDLGGNRLEISATAEPGLRTLSRTDRRSFLHAMQ